MKKPHLPLISYPGWLSLAWQLKIADFNIWITKFVSVEFTHKWSMQKSLVDYYKDQEIKRIKQEEKAKEKSVRKLT
jgi:hypothetical protein